MEDIKFTKLSSKGQIVIPQDMRKDFEIGTPFIIMRHNDTFLLRKIKLSKMKSWEEVTKPLRESIKKSDLKESDIPDILHRFRKKHGNHS